ncbi:TPA: oligosaccharide flippase family protein, partial [Citrobacter freundii]|nr:oligosaccharide flippase family protein [Citrobacter freundii]
MSLLRHSAYNLAGYILPTLIAIPSLGVISRCLGIEAFGIFMLIFALVGYSSIFDAGLTRAVIREVSIHKNNEQEQLKILSTSTAVVFILGIFAAVLLNVFSLQLIHFLKVSEIYFQDIKFIFYLLAVIIPIYLVNQIWLAYLEGEEQFAILNIQRTVTSSILAGLPAILVYFYGSLISAVYGIVISR